MDRFKHIQNVENNCFDQTAFNCLFEQRLNAYFEYSRQRHARKEEHNYTGQILEIKFEFDRAE